MSVFCFFPLILDALVQVCVLFWGYRKQGKMKSCFLKTVLCQFCLKYSLGKPQFDTKNEGLDHLPKWRCSIRVNGVNYECPEIFSLKKDAETAAASFVIRQLSNNGFVFPLCDTALCKGLLIELSVKKKLPPPTFSINKTGCEHAPEFTAVLHFNGCTYCGPTATNKREAEGKAAFLAIKGFGGEGVSLLDQNNLLYLSPNSENPATPLPLSASNQEKVGVEITGNSEQKVGTVDVSVVSTEHERIEQHISPQASNLTNHSLFGRASDLPKATFKEEIESMEPVTKKIKIEPNVNESPQDKAKYKKQRKKAKAKKLAVTS